MTTANSQQQHENNQMDTEIYVYVHIYAQLTRSGRCNLIKVFIVVKCSLPTFTDDDDNNNKVNSDGAWDGAEDEKPISNPAKSYAYFIISVSFVQFYFLHATFFPCLFYRRCRATVVLANEFVTLPCCLLQVSHIVQKLINIHAMQCGGAAKCRRKKPNWWRWVMKKKKIPTGERWILSFSSPVFSGRFLFFALDVVSSLALLQQSFIFFVCFIGRWTRWMAT